MANRTRLYVGIVIFLAFGGILFFGLRYAGIGEAPPPESGANAWQPMVAPDVELRTLANQPITLKQFRGKVVLLNFWASWCPPCREEFPALLELAQQYPDQLVLVAVSNDNTRAEITQFLDLFRSKYGRSLSGANVIVAWDQTQSLTHHTFGIVNFPETIVLDREQRMVRKVVGAEAWKSPELQQFIAGLMK